MGCSIRILARVLSPSGLVRILMLGMWLGRVQVKGRRERIMPGKRKRANRGRSYSVIIRGRG